MCTSHKLVKRCLDILIAVPATVLLLPVFGVVALLVKPGSKGPVLFNKDTF